MHVHLQALDLGLPLPPMGSAVLRLEGPQPQNLNSALEAEGNASSRTYCPIPGCIHHNPHSSPGVILSGYAGPFAGACHGTAT
eukprot:5317787-Amphidinium_carterae.1